MPYNPFDKQIGEKLDETDLASLVQNQVSEGWFVEYKSVFPDKAKIGHSIASFANTDGGWYIVGVQEQQRVATSICGFSLHGHPDPLSTVREIAKTHISPVPAFYPQLVTLASGQSVLAVYVPPEQETPFISKNGRVYRRVNDSSDPVPENDRHAFDRLIDAGREQAKRFQAFCCDDRSFSQAEASSPWMRIYLVPYPTGSFDKSNMLFDDEPDKLLQRSQLPFTIPLGELGSGVTGHLPFNYLQDSPGGISLRQALQGQAAFNTLTMQLDVNGRAKIFIPLSHCVRHWNAGNIHAVKSAASRSTLGRIMNDWDEQEWRLLSFVDIAELWLTIATLVTYYRDWLDTSPPAFKLRTSIQLENTWRHVAFYDDDTWAEHVDARNLPILDRGDIWLPYPIEAGVELDNDDTFPLWMTICLLAGRAFGLRAKLSAMAIRSALPAKANNASPPQAQ